MENLPNVSSSQCNMESRKNSTEEKRDIDAASPLQVSSATTAPRDKVPTGLNQAFFCPLTKQVFEDPVVANDGITYERVAIEKIGKFSESKVYPNRVLQAIIREELDTTIYEISPHMMQSVEQEDSLSERELTSRLRKVKESYCCPITMSVLQVPVIDPDGNTFERDAIKHWIRTHGTSPITRTSLTQQQLYSNTTLAYALQEVITDSKMIKFDPPASMQYVQIEPTTFEEAGDIEEGTAESPAAATTTNSGIHADRERNIHVVGMECHDWLWDAAGDLLRVTFFAFVACGCGLFWAYHPEFVVLLFVPVLVGICLLVDAMSNE